ncbi:MAG: tetratricopeptide repeat protein [Candidatus Eisenbacteria bacterium]|nr:tetratricopeptide repeat protein [Candidatus Eisenbacteria bacterium]
MHPRVRTSRFHPSSPRLPGYTGWRRALRALPALLALVATTLLADALPAPVHAQVDSSATARPPARPDSLAASAPAVHLVRTAPVPPRDLRHVQDWVDYRAAAHLASLPNEARLFYRRGLMARQAGQYEEAVLDVRGAAELDPSFVEPHLTLASWALVREPSQALLQYATVVDLLRQNFSLQLNLVANAAILLLEALFVGLLGAGGIVVWLRRRDLTHAWQEDIGRFASESGARWWATALVVLPYFAGFGLTLPTLFFLGFLWPYLRVRERSLFVVLLAFVAALPLTLRAVERMSLPLHANAEPFYAVPTLENQPYDAAREARLAALVAAHEQNPILHFGLAWTARRGGHLGVAERAYRRTLELWPDNDRAWNNLGNVVAMAGRPDEALKCYEKAIAANPNSAAPLYNSSQLYTQRFEYAKATTALSRASAINFELVRNYQSQGATDGLLPLVDEWLTPSVFWRALREAKLPADLAGSLPVSLRRHVEASGWPFSLAAVLLAAIGLILGLRQHRTLPLRACGNCGATVCRRCAERRREHALCPACVRVEAQGETGEFARVMLSRFRFARQRRLHHVRIALATLVPGYGLLAQRHVFTAVGLLGTSWSLLRAWLGTPPPFAIEPRLALSTQEVPPVVLLAVFAIVLANSVLGYLHLAARDRSREAALNSAQRGRITQASRRITSEAA